MNKNRYIGPKRANHFAPPHESEKSLLVDSVTRLGTIDKPAQAAPPTIKQQVPPHADIPHVGTFWVGGTLAGYHWP